MMSHRQLHLTRRNSIAAIAAALAPVFCKTVSENRTKLGMNKRVARKEDSISKSPLPLDKVKAIACRRCHARKTKCSGGKPCTSCTQSGCEEGCTYPIRDRQLKVNQSFIEKLLAENEQLRQASLSSPVDAVAADAASREKELGTDHNEGPISNPLIDERPWFLRMSSTDAPVLIGEAADAAFATRIRQALSDARQSHIPRVSYPSDSAILSLTNAPCPVPNAGRARFLVKSALRIVSECYHMVLKSSALENLESFLRNPDGIGLLLTCKIWALLAIGEVYSARLAAPELVFPGLAYFAQGNRALQVIQERPSIDAIEVKLLLCLYSLSVNRRHSAYCLAGSAVRQGVIMGLHLNVPEAQLGDKFVREHRNRVWWTAFEFNYLLAARLGHPTSIQGHEMQVDLPANIELPASSRADFADAEYLTARIKLAKLAGQITKSLYARRVQKEPFSQRVQQALKDLQDWLHSLPYHLQIDHYQTPQLVPDRIRTLHLFFNQCMVLATRPFLLSVLRAHRDAWQGSTPDAEPSVPENMRALTEACTRCARHSYSLLMEAWVDGSFSTFDYFYIQFLFSVATILAVTGLLNSPKDKDDFQLAMQLLEELKKSGNFAAVEFHQHLAAIQASITALGSWAPGQAGKENGVVSVRTEAAQKSSSLQSQISEPQTSTPSMTAEMALAEPSLQAFLAQADPSLQHMDISMLEVGHGLDGFYWPDNEFISF